MRKLDPMAFAMLAGCLIPVRYADAGGPDTIYSPHVEQGEWELEYKGRYLYGPDRDGASQRETQNKVALGYGPTSHWWTELYAEREATPERGDHWSAFEWENRFQLTEPGQYWLDLGAIAELERARPGKGKEARVGLLMEKDIDRTTLTVNWLIGRTFGDGASSHWEQDYRAQWAWRWRLEARPLLQLQGDGDSAYAGPGIAGKLRIGAQRVGYHLAWLHRLGGDVTPHALRLQVELEF